MKALITIALYAGILVLDYGPNMRDKRRGEKLAYLALLTAGFVLATLHAAGVQVPSPAFPIEHAVHAIFGVE